ncbi:MAG: SPOR domain-containing protein [Gemmatimonadales bacterium]|nr:SPOR domain-containing protein [Gemmatimonadales bacterium]
MNLKNAIVAGSLVWSSAACAGEPDLAAGNLPAVGRGPSVSSALRVPLEGGEVRLYRLPSLEPSAWKLADKLPPLQRAVGADPEQGLVFLLDKKRNVVALDLETRRVRPSLEQVRHATVGPDGALYAVDTSRSVIQLMRRTPVRFRSKLQGTPGELHGTMGGMLVASLRGDEPRVEVLGSDRPPASFEVPGGQQALSFWGDLIAVAADSAVVIYETEGDSDGDRDRLSIPVSGGAKAAMFSPSGHRIYVARASDGLLVLDRVSGQELQEIDLPGPAVGLRGDVFGQWVLVRPASGDSAWVVDVGKGGLVGTVDVEWDDDLPAAVAPNTLLTRRAKDVVAVDLGAAGFPVRGTARDAAGDTWLPITWHPAQEQGIPVNADSAALAAAADSAGRAAAVYLQVSSSQNPVWADELSQKLRAAGLPAAVLKPARSDEAFRVVLGPYATREQAEETGRGIGMPSFVVTTQDPQ